MSISTRSSADVQFVAPDFTPSAADVALSESIDQAIAQINDESAIDAVVEASGTDTATLAAAITDGLHDHAEWDSSDQRLRDELLLAESDIPALQFLAAAAAR
jgi:hypothetical protein